MALYDPTDHPLLSTAAAALGAPALEEQAALAEDLLGLADTAFTDADADSATRAVVLQVNFQVESGTEGEVYGSQTRGDRQVGFRGGVLNPMPMVSPRALAIVRGLMPLATSGAWPTAGSIR